MTSSPLGSVVGALLIAAGLLLVSTTGSQAASTDTPDVVMKTGAQAAAQINNQLNGLRQQAGKATAQARAEFDSQISGLGKLQLLIARLGRDRAFATQTLNLSRKIDKPGLAKLWGNDVPGAVFEVRDIKDWYVYALVEVDGYVYEVCLASDGSCKGAIITLAHKAKAKK